MTLTCPRCSHINPDQSTFCIKCGYRLQSFSQSSTGQLPSSPLPATTAGILPSPLPSIGTGEGQSLLRRAFAGHGASVMHQSWLLDGKQIQAATVRTAIFDILRRRNIPGLTVKSEKLMERGILVEERDYLTIQRGVSTVFIYTAPAGQDLYISRATAVRTAINSIRVVALILLLGLALFGPSILTGFAGPAAFLLGNFFFLLSLPIWFYFIWLLFRSFIYWLIEKDFWYYLRSIQLNDFQMDDIALLEHITDDTVRAAVEQLGLDASKIVPPTQGYQHQPKQRIRAI